MNSIILIIYLLYILSTITSFTILSYWWRINPAKVLLLSQFPCFLSEFFFLLNLVISLCFRQRSSRVNKEYDCLCWAKRDVAMPLLWRYWKPGMADWRGDSGEPLLWAEWYNKWILSNQDPSLYVIYQRKLLATSPWCVLEWFEDVYMLHI